MTLFIDTGAPGYWRDAIANSPCLRVLPAMPFQRGFDPAQDGGKPDARRVTRVSPFIHSETHSRKGQPDRV